MDLLWTPGPRRFVATEGEAKKAKNAFEKRSVPTTKPALIAYLNEQEEDREAAVAAAFEDGRAAGLAEMSGARANTTTTPATPAPRTAVATDGRSLVEQVADLEPAQLPAVLSAAIGRLGEVAGIHGWAAFAKNVYAWSPGARSVEQGLGMLMLAALDTMGTQPVAEKARPITADKTTGDE